MTNSRIAVVTGTLALACYGLLKTMWVLGSRVGVRNLAEWDRVFGGLSGLQHWLALWGTVVLAAAGVGLLAAVHLDDRTPFGRGVVRRIVRGFAWSVAVLLGIFAVVAIVSTVITDVRVAGGAVAQSPMASWVYYLTYGSFLVYAGSLAVVCGSTGAAATRARRAAGRRPT